MLQKGFKILIFALLFPVCSYATHVMGGELIYKYLGNNKYEFTVKLYRNCSPGGAQAPKTATIRIKYGNTTGANPKLPLISIINITDTISNDPCLVVPPNVCVEEYIYQNTFNIPNIPPGGLHVTFSLRNRNWSIGNLVDPGSINMILYEHIPDTLVAKDNSTPTFTFFPPTFICVNEPFVFDHSATDADGDSLYYELYHPYGAPNGNYGNSSNFDPTINADTPVIPLIPFLNPYNENDPMGGVPLTIDQNGILRAIPNLIGQYVVGILVSEYRNGVLIGRHLKDFQFNVTDCQRVQARIRSGFGALVGCGNTVTFPNRSIGANNFFWDFGVSGIDSDTSREISPIYVYPGIGEYEVMLIAEPGSECSDTVFVDVNIKEAMVPDFVVNDVCDGYPAIFTDNSQPGGGGFIIFRKWDFGDGTFSSVRNPTHLYDSAGVYDVTLEITSNLGCIDSITKQVEVKQAPTAKFTADTTGGCEPLRISFIDSSEGANQYHWDLGDGTIRDTMASSFSILHTYTGEGLYYVELITTFTPTGCTDTAKITISNYPNPEANIEIINPIGCSPLKVFFDNKSERAAKYFWDFGNGNTSEDSIPPPVTYTNSGVDDTTYLITLIASSSFGCSSDTIIDSVIVKPKSVSILLPNDTLCIGQSILIDDVVEDSLSTYEWIPAANLSDPTIANPVATPEQTTNYVVLKNYYGNCYDTIHKKIVVHPLPEIILPSDQIICRGDSAYFEVEGDGVIFEWKPEGLFDDPNSSTPTTQPLNDENYVFTVIVTDTNGCIDSGIVNIATKFPFVDAGKEVVILKGESTQLKAEAAEDVTFDWQPENTLNNNSIANPVATPPVTTLYDVVVEINGCMSQDSVLVRVIDMILDVPNAFSPDGDNQNDFIKAEGRDVYKFEFKIFDRWGVVVFETNDIDQSWDGKYNGKFLDMDTYVYYAIAKSELDTKIIKKGNITLLR